MLFTETVSLAKNTTDRDSHIALTAALSKTERSILKESTGYTGSVNDSGRQKLEHLDSRKTVDQ